MAKVKIGEKEYDEADVAKAIEEVAALKTQMAPVLQMTQRFGWTPEELVQHASGSFGMLSQLQEAGVIDQNGQIVKVAPKEPEVKPVVPPSSHSPVDSSSIEAIVNKALNPLVEKLNGIEGRFGTVEQTQSLLFRDRIMERVKREGFETLSENDVSQLLGKASATKQDFWKLAKETNESRQNLVQSAVDTEFKKYNIDRAQLNKLNEMKADDSKVGAAVLEGKKISLRKEEGAITPKEATQSYFKTLNEIEERT